MDPSFPFILYPKALPHTMVWILFGAALLSTVIICILIRRAKGTTMGFIMSPLSLGISLAISIILGTLCIRFF